MKKLLEGFLLGIVLLMLGLFANTSLPLRANEPGLLVFGPEYQITYDSQTTKVFVQTAAMPKGDALISFVEKNELRFFYLRKESLQAEPINPPTQAFIYPARPHILYDDGQDLFISYFHAYMEGTMPRIWYLSIHAQSGESGEYQTIPVEPQRSLFRQMYPYLVNTAEERIFIWQEDNLDAPGLFTLWAQSFNRKDDRIGENKPLDFAGLNLQLPKVVYDPETINYTVSGLRAYISEGMPKVDLYARVFDKGLNPVSNLFIAAENIEIAADYSIFHGGKMKGIWIAFAARGSLWLNELKPGSVPREIAYPESNYFVNAVDGLVATVAGKTYFIFLWRQQSSTDPNNRNYFVTVFDPKDQEVNQSIPLPGSSPKQRFASLTDGFVFWEGIDLQGDGNDIFGAKLTIASSVGSFRQFFPLMVKHIN